MSVYFKLMTRVKTILYAEDDAVVLTAYRMRLEKAGYHVIAASDGLDAMRKLSTLVPDLIILDLMLPKFNGEEVLQFTRTQSGLARVPIIILSTNSVRDAAQENLLEHAGKRLIKSQCTAGMLLDAVEEVLQRSPAEPIQEPTFPRTFFFPDSRQPVAV